MADVGGCPAHWPGKGEWCAWTLMAPTHRHGPGPPPSCPFTCPVTSLGLSCLGFAGKILSGTLGSLATFRSVLLCVVCLVVTLEVWTARCVPALCALVCLLMCSCVCDGPVCVCLCSRPCLLEWRYSVVYKGKKDILVCRGVCGLCGSPASLGPALLGGESDTVQASKGHSLRLQGFAGLQTFFP